VERFVSEQVAVVKKISEKQKAFLNEIMLKRRFMKIGIKENKMIKQRIDKFFTDVHAFEGKFTELKNEREAIVKELNDIMKLAEQYKVMAKRNDMTKEFKKLQERSEQVNSRKQKFKANLNELKKKVKGTKK
jgi:uncharacterized protein (DUF3084 family)